MYFVAWTTGCINCKHSKHIKTQQRKAKVIHVDMPSWRGDASNIKEGREKTF